MQKIFLTLLSLSLFMCLSIPSFSDDRLTMKECAFIHLRASDGWWISINNDGSGSYGFGTGLARVNVKENTYNFEQVFTSLEKVFGVKPETGESVYMALSYWKAKAGSATEYYLALDRQLLTGLFFAARNNMRPPENEPEKQWHDKVESHWRRSQWNMTSPEHQ